MYSRLIDVWMPINDNSVRGRVLTFFQNCQMFVGIINVFLAVIKPISCFGNTQFCVVFNIDQCNGVQNYNAYSFHHKIS